MNEIARIVLIGIGATAFTDLWAILRARLFGMPLPNFAMVGRWFSHLARGRFRHESIAAAEQVRHEGLIGWTAHYLIGIAFAALLVAIFGSEWTRRPTIGPALIVGITTVVFPFLFMQPGMGAGIAASRTPNPAAARAHSIATHAIFGLGLYVSARVVGILFPLAGG